MTVADKLDIIESFVRIMPMAVKSGELVFFYNCVDYYRSYVCEHAVVTSML